MKYRTRKLSATVGLQIKTAEVCVMEVALSPLTTLHGWASAENLNKNNNTIMDNFPIFEMQKYFFKKIDLSCAL